MTPSSIEMETRSVKSMAGTAVTNGSQSSLDLYLDYTANNGRGTPIHQTFIQSPLSKLSSLDQRANTHSGELKGSLNAQEKGLATGSILSRTTMKSEPLTLFSGVGPSKTGGTANLPDISLSASSPEFKSMPLPPYFRDTDIMKFGYILMLMVATVVPDALAFVCPDAESINYACRQLNVFPLVCYDPSRNVQECNAKQCNQPYIDNYSTCQCRRSMTDFYESSRNVGGLIRRCGGGFTNPYGDSSQYRPGQGTATFPTSATATGATGAPGSMTRIYDGTTYYGGQTGVVSGTTRIVSATAVVGGTTIFSGTTTWVSETPRILSGSSSPAMIITEKVEPVVVRTDAGQAAMSGAGASSSGYGTGTGGYNPAPRP
ncbi:hypothetical protein BGW38_000669 [Lunasporangiospora selenospora]|uniref:Uncharacterized protein n=1 Tax=Lunasporangiospora selenospora TaxID=979761 RepID=A0A9P6KET3_9FUNG|nr:hypothetical protein BGW38_000669 [Lunasporangiospora selenospora]